MLRDPVASDRAQSFAPGFARSSFRIPLPPPTHATIAHMKESPRAITWEAPEHTHTPKTPEWFIILGILAVSGSIAAFLFGNVLFAILILVAAVTISLVTLKEPDVIPYSVSTRGIRVGDEIHTYPSLESFCINTTDYDEPHLLVQSTRLFMPLLVFPIPEEYMDDIDDLLGERLPEEELEEPFIHVLLEFFGF